MKNSSFLAKLLYSGCGLLSSLSSYAVDSAALESQANKRIQTLYSQISQQKDTSMAERINWFSAQFIDTPYYLGSLGEGPEALYDQFPRYRTDAFDCDTYVNTVISLALANSLAGFQHCVNANRYQNGKVAYIYRNHFTDLDWNKNNQKRGLFKDITFSFKDQNKQPVAIYASALVDKPNWYAHKILSTIRLQQDNPAQAEQRLNELKAKGAHLEVKTAKVPYLPFTALFNDGKPNMYLFSQIPQGAIIEIVRPNWDIRDEAGSSTNISHLGFAIWKDGQVYFREASSEYHRVVDVPLVNYLHDALKSPTIRGINVQVLIPQQPASSC